MLKNKDLNRQKSKGVVNDQDATPTFSFLQANEDYC